MDRLWTPWRFQYISTATPEDSACILCAVQDTKDDAASLILHRGSLCYALLNLYPYTSGHLMVVTKRHIAALTEATDSEMIELMHIARLAQKALDGVYHPDGFNLGMNLGAAAGAGVAGHLHLHVLPRWTGDANFMSVVGETRVLPELLQQSYSKLSPYFR